MTAIAARIYPDRILVATDSGTFYGDTVTLGEKFFCAGGVWFGGAGIASNIVAFQAELEKRKWPARFSVDGVYKWLEAYNKRRNPKGDDNEESDYLVVFDGRLLSISGMFFEEIEDFAAIGSGQLACLIAMDLGLSPSEAVDAACRRVATCRPPVREYVLPRKRR